MRGAAIHRELGHCLLLTNELPDARHHLKEARKSDPTNKFVLDLDIQVAIAERRFLEARRSIDQLELIDDRAHVQHRLSRLEAAEGNFPAAFEAADRAVKSSAKPHFEVITQYTSMAIRIKKINEARDGLAMLEKRFPRVRSDIKNGLWARFYIAQGMIDEAESSWSKISHKNTEIHKRIRENIIELKLNSRAMPPEQRAPLNKELELMRASPKQGGLSDVDAELF